ncbi:MAG: hypothetical protein V1831_04400 [Candidatus Woesearchaeota archaeon]
MLNFIKKLFAKQEIVEEKIGLDQLDYWLDQKSKPLFEDLNNNISQIIGRLNNEKERISENLRVLENAKLQNPKIPERVKTIVEGNRVAFIKKISFFLDNIDLKFNDFDELTGKCKNIEDELDLLAKSTAKSYQVLNEFFAREAEHVAMSIKKVENCSKDIRNSMKHSRIPSINKIKNSIIAIQQKIKLKHGLAKSMENEKLNLQRIKGEELEIENRINETTSSTDYKNYEKLLEDRDKARSGLNGIENTLFHDFSVLERALKKYTKIAFENEALIISYLNSPVKALVADNNLEIINILNNLEKSIADNKLELDAKKSEKTLSKIKELRNDYFFDFQNRYHNLKQKLNEIRLLIENNKSNNELKLDNKELESVRLNIESINIGILSCNNELEKISIEKLKEDLQREINLIFDARVTVL